MIPIIDTHQHLVLDRWPYSWTKNMLALAGKTFDAAAYARASDGTGIAHTIFMETSPDDPHWREETKVVCAMAVDLASPIVGSIINCRPEEAEGLEAYLEETAHPRRVGLRRTLHGPDDTISQTPHFRRNVRLLAKHNLTFDMCYLARQLPIALDLARECRGIRLILDHCGVPGIKAGSLDPWRGYIRQLDGFDRIALVAFVRPGASAPLESAVENRPEDLRERLPSAGVVNLSIFTKSIGDRTFAFVYFDFRHDDARQAQDALFTSSESFSTLSRHLAPHPRAESAERPWLRTELITVVAADAPKAATPVEKIGLMSGLKPECALSHRTLHQTNWPGVVDCMVQCNCRNWTTFLFELGAELFLFTFFEYIGRDRNADNDLMAANPTTQRWWTHTVPCLVELEPGCGPWTSTIRILSID